MISIVSIGEMQAAHYRMYRPTPILPSSIRQRGGSQEVAQPLGTLPVSQKDESLSNFKSRFSRPQSGSMGVEQPAELTLKKPFELSPAARALLYPATYSSLRKQYSALYTPSLSERPLTQQPQEQQPQGLHNWRSQFLFDVYKHGSRMLSRAQTQVKEAASQVKAQGGFLTPAIEGNLASESYLPDLKKIEEEKKQRAAALESQLQSSRTTFEKQKEVSDWRSWMPHFNRTPQQERTYNAGENVLNLYDQIAKERLLSDQERIEIRKVTQKMETLAYESEKKKIDLLKQDIFAKKPATLEGKMAEMKEKVLRKVVDRLKLVEYVEGQVGNQIGQVPISENKKKYIADQLIDVTVGGGGSLVGEGLAAAGFDKTLLEQTEANVEWWIGHWAPELAKEIEIKMQDEMSAENIAHKIQNGLSNYTNFFDKQSEQKLNGLIERFSQQVAQKIEKKIKDEKVIEKVARKIENIPQHTPALHQKLLDVVSELTVPLLETINTKIKEREGLVE